MKKHVFYIIVIFSLLTIISSFASTENSTPGNTSVLLDLAEVHDVVAKKDNVAQIAFAFVLPRSVESIDDEAFEGTAIVRIELPENANTIGERAFANISTLRFIRIPRTTTTIATTAFNGSEKVTINASPNSYARKFAKNQGLLFQPITTFCASAYVTPTVFIINSLYEAIDVENVVSQEHINYWKKLEEKKIVGILDIIYNSIRGRGPPFALCEKL